MKNLDFWDLFIWFILWLVVLGIILWLCLDIYLYFHCWGLPLNDELPYECFNKWFYSVINNN